MTPASVLDMLREARAKGLRAPVMLMGYYNPVMRYGEERFLSDARKAGANGFIMVDLPPEEAVRFRDLSKKEGYVVSCCSLVLLLVLLFFFFFAVRWRRGMSADQTVCRTFRWLRPPLATRA